MSGSAAASVAYCLLVDGGVVVIWLLSAMGWGAWPTAWLVGRKDAVEESSRPMVVITMLAVGLGILSLITLGRGLTGILGFSTGIASLAVGWLAGLAFLWKPHQSASLLQYSPGVTEEGVNALRINAGDNVQGSLAWRWSWLLVVVPLSISLLASFVPPGLLWKPDEPHGYDAVEYHLQLPREWLEAGKIIPLQHNVFSYFPSGMEMHYLLALEIKGGAWQGMYAAQLMHVAMTAAGLAAIYAVSLSISRHRALSTIATLAAALTPWMSRLAPLAFNEGGLLLFGTLAIGWALQNLKSDGHRSGRVPPTPLRGLALAGLLAGFACGVKLTAGPLFLAAIPIAMFVVMARRSFRVAILGSVVFAVVGVCIFSPWVIRNIAWCGNPVFPEASSIFGKAHFTDDQIERWKHAHAPQPEQQPIPERWKAFINQVVLGWEFGFILLPIGLLAVLWNCRRQSGQLLGVLLLIHAVFWIGFTHLQGRFFVPAIPIASIALATVPWSRIAGSYQRLTLRVLLIVVAVGGLFGQIAVYRKLSMTLDGFRDDNGRDIRSAIVGGERLDWLSTAILTGFPQDDPAVRLYLAGDAQAFWYDVPMSRLRYRTPFDVSQGPESNVFEAYLAGRDAKSWIRVDPAELDRFSRTYQPFPKVPPEARRSPAWKAGESSPPYVVPPGSALVP